MIFYDDKTKGIVNSGNQFMIQSVDVSDDIIFKASFVVLSDLNCTGKITALFDLIVIGNLRAAELDVKGRFICLGNCLIDNILIVQNDIWAQDIRVRSIICHDRIVAQEIDAITVEAEGKIILGKILAIEERAQTYQNIICGDTAYGAGKLVATSIMTSEPLDLDDGEEALKSPYIFTPQKSFSFDTGVEKELACYRNANDYSGFLNKLLLSSDKMSQEMFSKYLTVLKTIDCIYPLNVKQVRDIALLVWLIEIANSEYFKSWEIISEWLEAVKKHFDNVIHGNVMSEIKTKPAVQIKKGYTVAHVKYGYGIVDEIKSTALNGAVSEMATVRFENYGEKKFPLPDALKYFTVLSETPLERSEAVKNSLQCNINSYSEWLAALTVINEYKDYLGIELHEVIYELLLAKIGLKPKFVEARFKEKGWD